MRNLILTAVILMATVTYAGEKVTVPVVHDTTGRTLTANDRAYLASCPEHAGGNFRQANKELILGGAMHIAPRQKYVPNTSAMIWRMYQVWTARKKAEVPISEVIYATPPRYFTRQMGGEYPGW